MAFDLSSPNVHRSLDPLGLDTAKLFQLEHIDLPYTPSDIPEGFPPDQDGERQLASAYFDMLRNERVYEIPPGPLNLKDPLIPNPSAPQSIQTVYQLADRKSLHGHTVFSIAHTHFGLQVWQSGLAITMSRDPVSSQPRITSSHSTIYLHATLTQEAQFAPDPDPGLPAYSDFNFMPDKIDEVKLATVLGLDPNAVKIDQKQLIIYLYDENTRLLGGIPSSSPIRESFQGNLPDLPLLPKIDPSHEVQNGKHYIVSEVVFTTIGVANRSDREQRVLSWRAFVEVQRGGVLYLRPLVASCFQTIFPSSTVTRGPNNTYSKIFAVDPATARGANAYAGAVWNANFIQLLDGATIEVNLQNLPVSNPQTLSNFGNRYVKLDNSAQAPQPVPPWDPTENRDANGADFTKSVNQGALTQNEFTNVSAYFQSDLMFRMMELFGFTEPEIKFDYFRTKTDFPITVDPQGTDQLLDAEVYLDASRDGVRGIAFGPVQSSSTANRFPVGNATDPRVVAHEFSHVLLLGSTQSLNFQFAHSVGDSLAAILCDPGSLAPDKTNTFPWLSGLNAADPNFTKRYHKASNGNKRGDLRMWGWGGDNDINDVPGRQPAPGYLREQILSMSLFRLYEALGGCSSNLEKQRFAARYVAYLIVQAIFLASYDRCAPLTKANEFETKLEEADADMQIFNNGQLAMRRGVVRKVVRWAFEKQGMFKSNPPASSGMGAPPSIDAYIDDGRRGEYDFKQDYSTTEIWNHNTRYAPHVDMNALDPVAEHQDAIAGQTNFIYVRVWNRGATSALNAGLAAYTRVGADPNSMNWDGGWSPMQSNPANTSGFPIDPGQHIVRGPFEWTPSLGSGAVCVLVRVSVSEGDPSVLDTLPASPGNLIPIWWLVPADNNIGVRVVPVVG